jgi:putative aldouronate transport system substrate-binding protein
MPTENNSIMQEVQKRTGIIWRPTLVGTNEYASKLNSMIAAGTLPNIFSFSLVEGQKYVENKMLTQLSDLLKNYGKDIIKDRESVLYQGLNNSKEVWGVPTPPGYPAMLSVRNEWLKKLSLKVPTDLDSLYQVAKAFTKNDPDGDGKDNTIGFGIGLLHGGGFNVVFNALGVTKSGVMVDGKVTTYMKHPKYLEGIKFLRKLYSEGLMELDFATIPTTTLYDRLWNGTYGMFDHSPSGQATNWVARYKENPKRELEWTIIKGPDGTGGVIQPRSSSYYGISASCKNPQEAMTLANYFGTTEGNDLLHLGIENKHYKWVDKAQGTVEYLPPYNDPNVHRTDGGYVYSTYFKKYFNDSMTMTLTSLSRKGIELGNANWVKDYYIYNRPEIEKELGVTLTDIENEALANLIVTTGNLETEYKAYVDRWMKEGGSKWEEQATVIWNKEHAK